MPGAKAKIGKEFVRALLGAGVGLYGGHKLVEGEVPGISGLWGGIRNTSGKLQHPMGKILGYGVPTVLGAAMGAKGRKMFMRPGGIQRGKVIGGDLSKRLMKDLNRGGSTIVEGPGTVSVGRTFASLMTPIGLSAVPHMVDRPTATLYGIRGYIDQASKEFFGYREKMRRYKERQRQGIESDKPTLFGETGKSFAGGVLGDWWKKNKGELLPAAKDLASQLGLAAGGGIAGYYGGGALGGLIGRLIAPDKKKGKYEERRSREKTRELSETIGKILGSYGAAVALPLLVRKLSGNRK